MKPTDKRMRGTALDQEAARISERQRSDLKAFVKDMVQISTGILGFVTGIAGIAPNHKRKRGAQSVCDK
jgi:hypothetical protein